MTVKIYAAGPIGNTNFKGATGWYADARRYLPEGFQLLRPMRGKNFLEREAGTLDGVCDQLQCDEFETSMVDRRMILGRDAWDVERCDAVLMNLTDTGHKVSVGCMMELGMAHAFRKPVILVTSRQDETDMKYHPMVQQAVTAHVTTLLTGCSILTSLFCDEL